MSLALWLRAGRAERGLSLDDVARVTKIQPRILERLESGAIKPGDGLPADVFLRGFIRSFAKCCGLDEQEALRRYSACTAQLAGAAPVAARAVVDAMADLAPRTSEGVRVAVTAPAVPERAAIQPPPAPAIGTTPVETATVDDARADVAVSAATSKKKKRRGGKRAKRKSLATGTPSQPMPIVAAPTEAEAEAEVAVATARDAMPQAALEPMTDAPGPVTAAPPTNTAAAPASSATAVAPAATVTDAAVDPTPVIEPALDPLVAPASADEDVIATPIWQPKMPPLATTASVPWRGPTSAAYVARSAAPAVPTLVIDDADPEGAEQVREERAASRSQTRRSFLPPILLDHEDRSTRQGGLTLAVIILLIAATLTLSYLMRRPSSSGDGVTQAPALPALVGDTLVG